MPTVNDRPGAFELSDVFLISYAEGAEGNPKRLNIRNLITEFNIYEKLNGDFLSGDMVITDATNAIQELPLTGFERIEFYFRSPKTPNGFNFSVLNGHPMFVYNLKNRQSVSINTQIYQLKFISMEGVRDHQTRISQAFTGSIDQMVADICYNYLNTKKDLLVEETKGSYKIVIPRIKSSAALKMLKNNARSKHFENSGFVFYESANGFNFKSYEGLFCKKDGSPRMAKANYAVKVKNTMKKEDDGKQVYDLQAVESWKILNQYNTLKNTADGIYASRLVTHDLFNKTFKEHDFNYFSEYVKQNHLEQVEQDARVGMFRKPSLNKKAFNGILPFFNYDKGDTFASKNEGTLHYQSTTSKIHNNYEQPEVEHILQKRISQSQALNSLTIEITVPGITEIRVGDIVTFTLPNYRKTPEEDLEAKDTYISGRYLINAARHHVSAINKRHTMVLELVKDSFNIEYPGEATDYFTNNENDKGLLYSASHLDEFV